MCVLPCVFLGRVGCLFEREPSPKAAFFWGATERRTRRRGGAEDGEAGLREREDVQEGHHPRLRRGEV